MNNKFKQFILLGGDVLILFASLYLTLTIRYHKKPSIELWRNHINVFVLIFFFWILIFYIFDLYNLKKITNTFKFFQKIIQSIVLASFLSITFFYLSININITPKRNLFIFILIATFLLSVWRTIFNKILKTYLPKNKIAIIGLNQQSKELIQMLKNKEYTEYKISFILDDEQEKKKSEENIPIYKTKELKNLVFKKNINIIVSASNLKDSYELRKNIFSCLNYKITYVNFPKFYEEVTGKIPINAINQMWFLENLNEANKIFFNKIKRFYDIILAFILLIITLPIWILVGIIIKIESRGPVFFKQIRLGKNGKKFKIIKFRTMKEDNNHYKPTQKNDKRITRFGLLLRKTRIDELPQTINILKNEMSFVGPRPERPELIEKLEKLIPFYKERMMVKPGVTGWDQISGEYHSPSVEDTIKKLQNDLYYIKNRSIILDLSIILKTIATVLSRAGR